ncbi:MAG: hypothetical protein R2695_01800 [Acidimicrobiales bacterium]
MIAVAVAGKVRMATSGRRSFIATVSHVWAFCAPPWISTNSGSPVPQTRADSASPEASGTATRRTNGGSS